MKYNSTENNICQAYNRFMELTSPLLDLSNNKDTYLRINNTICCFNCREYCKAEYTTRSDWLTRSRRSFSLFHEYYYHYYCYLKRFYFILFSRQTIKLYHRHRRKLLTNSRFKNSISNLFENDDDDYYDDNAHSAGNSKYFYLKSIKAKFRTRI